MPADAPLVWVDTYLDERPDESAAFNDGCAPRWRHAAGRRVVDWSRSPPRTASSYDGIHPSETASRPFADVVTGAVDAWLADDVERARSDGQAPQRHWPKR